MFKSLVGSTSSLFAIALFLMAVGAGRAHANLIRQDWITPGDGLITADTGSGLEWLSLNVTVLTPHYAVSSSLGEGKVMEGWRYAKEWELVALETKLWVAWYSQEEYEGGSYFAALREAQTIFGYALYEHTAERETWVTEGIYEDNFTQNLLFRSYSAIRDLGTPCSPNGCLKAKFAQGIPTESSLWSSSNFRGSFLVREIGSAKKPIQSVAVTEPSSILILPFVALTLALSRIARKRICGSESTNR